MTKHASFPFTLWSSDPSGVTLTVFIGADAITSRGITLLPADTLEVTELIYSYNVDRNGNCFLDLTADEQIAIWGRVRFGTGDVPESVAATAKAERDALARRELDFLKHANPALAKASAAALRFRELEQQLGE
jgi:hypothetical protein